MTAEFLYVFGYQSPIEHRGSLAFGDDAEATGAFRIKAESEDEALQWGRTLSAWYIQGLVGEGSGPIWDQDNYASWIEGHPDEYLLDFGSKLPTTNSGTYPDFDAVRRVFGD